MECNSCDILIVKDLLQPYPVRCRRIQHFAIADNLYTYGGQQMKKTFVPDTKIMIHERTSTMRGAIQ